MSVCPLSLLSLLFFSFSLCSQRISHAECAHTSPSAFLQTPGPQRARVPKSRFFRHLLSMSRDEIKGFGKNVEQLLAKNYLISANIYCVLR
ncbi:hypothetical protein T310_5744 [Rasamsonia emersonii CBS 393.64]|uniref:Uncharacterized protein n=1 Tax=Rasamsonia emersonii (strain ATCC 16479 / CBS 393.64 / IMI 116815) TaxID=1408163 RepID=A0A0F4YRK1_RASE3|nr:hypothetical protein T310_5744 [Rasamsonia emersonii CBS 393.64]KKA20238.1 hypothetical protein T310_5744 [Rasamsonia emersonii CBS 393.64]